MKHGCLRRLVSTGNEHVLLEIRQAPAGTWTASALHMARCSRSRVLPPVALRPTGLELRGIRPERSAYRRLPGCNLQARLLIDGQVEPIVLRSGDCFMLSRGTPFVLGSDLDMPAEPADRVFAAASHGTAVLGSGEDFHVVGGKMLLDELSEPLLTGELPDCVFL